jgi:hypothetical protein
MFKGAKASSLRGPILHSLDLLPGGPCSCRERRSAFGDRSLDVDRGGLDLRMLAGIFFGLV